MAEPSDNFVTRNASGLYNGAKDVGSAVANSGWAQSIKDLASNQTVGGAAGMVGVGLLFYMVGNIFGGGGFIGNILGLMLGVGFAGIGKLWGQNNLDPFIAQAAGRNGSAPARNDPSTTVARSPAMSDPGLAAAAEEYCRSGGKRCVTEAENGAGPPPGASRRYAARGDDTRSLR